MKARIIVIKDYADNPPNLIKDSRCSVKVINNLIESLLSIISSITRNEVTDKSIDGIEREIRLFLSNLHIVMKGDISSNDDKKIKKMTPYWLSTYGYQSLLNILICTRFFGPMINLWEGSNQGEGYLRFAKPKVNNIYSKNWQINAH